MSVKSSRKHSEAFKKIVSNYADDEALNFEEIIAYFFYKRNKVMNIDVIENVSSQSISDEQLNKLHERAVSDEELNKIKAKAKSFSDGFAESLKQQQINTRLANNFQP